MKIYSVFESFRILSSMVHMESNSQRILRS